MRQRKLQKGVTAMQIKLLANVFAVFFDSARADTKLFADVFGSAIFRDEFENAALSRCEIVDGRLAFPQSDSPAAAVDEKRSQCVARIMLAGSDGLDALYN